MPADFGGAGNLIGLGAGLLAAFATVIVAIVNSRNSRRDERDNLQRDIDLVKQLQKDTRAKRVLEWHITAQIINNAINYQFKRQKRIVFFLFLATETLLVAALVTSAAKTGTNLADGLPDLLLVLGPLTACIYVCLEALVTKRVRAARKAFRLGGGRLTKPELKPSKPRRRSRRLKAAWRALTSDPIHGDPPENAPTPGDRTENDPTLSDPNGNGLDDGDDPKPHNDQGTRTARD